MMTCSSPRRQDSRPHLDWADLSNQDLETWDFSRYRVFSKHHKYSPRILSCDGDVAFELACCMTLSSLGVVGTSFRGGIRSLIASNPLASAKDVILWLGEKPCRAFFSEDFPPESAPSGRAPVGVNPFNCSTDSDSSLQTLIDSG